MAEEEEVSELEGMEKCYEMLLYRISWLLCLLMLSSQNLGTNGEDDPTSYEELLAVGSC